MIYTFDKLMNVLSPLSEQEIIDLYEEIEVTGIGNTFYLQTEPKLITEEVRYIGIPTESGDMFRVYEINQRKEGEYQDEFLGVDFAIKDLSKDGVVIEHRNNGSDFRSVITNQVLNGSSWTLGAINFTAKTNESFYYQSRWGCLTSMIEESGCEIQMIVAISNNKISRRYINFFKQIGNETQKRFEYGSNILSVTKDSDESNIITRIYPRGRGEEIQDENTGSGTGNFTRRITIKDVEWKKTAGRPLDKPKGQEWLEDPELTARYPLHTGKPRTGVVIYEDCEEPSELIQLGYETLKLNGVPKSEFKVVAPTDASLSLGDIVTVVNYERVYDLRTRIFKMKRFPLETFKNEYTFGDEVNRSAYKEVQNIIHENNKDIFEYVNGKVISAANGINKVYFGKEFPTKAMKGDLFYKYIGINAKGEQDIEMWEFDGTTWNKIVDTAMADADRLVKGRIDAGKINVINLNAANITTGILRSIKIDAVDITASTLQGDKVSIDLKSGKMATNQTANGGTTTVNYGEGQIVFSDSRAPSNSKYKASITGWGVREGNTGVAYPDLQLSAYKGARIFLNEYSTELRLSGPERRIQITAGDTYVSGNLNVQGTKNAIHPTRNGVRETPAYETAESYLGDIGTTQTDDKCISVVPIEELFSDVINTEYEYQVFLQSYGDGYVFVKARMKDRFIVQSSSPNICFAWEIKAKRRGHEDKRLALNKITLEDFKVMCEKEGGNQD
ncbi:phage tail protein [Lactococcus lactis]|uniref:phage tail spike protein n=1 Tax=Lactococcus lactis TaxID=1358 RepID=UPI0024184360|nr:phage tail spike protein [Lactococcus lactis]MDG4966253.1 phage tail protein [Lactococcus lactis]